MTPCSDYQNRLAFGVSTNPRVSSQPIYVRLQTLQEGSVVFLEAIPQSFDDSVAAVNVSVLAVLVSSNARSITIYNDDVGNLWLAVNYTFKKGDYISILMWVSSETADKNLVLSKPVPFPESYPNDVKPFLNPGRKIPVNDTIIKDLAESFAAQDMIETIENILSFVNSTQNYDRDKVRLLMTGKLNTTDILDFINDPLVTLQTNNSFCFERALFAATMLRTVGVPTRTFTSAELKTWIQVWLPEIGWVDAEVLCTQPSPKLFPRPLSFVMPRMVENSSDAMFPFTWSPKILMRVANLTFSSFEDFNVNEYGAVLSQPVNEDLYETSPDDFSFPLIFKPKRVQAALTWNDSDVVLHISNEEKKSNKTLILGKTNTIEFESFGLSFKPIRQGGTIILYNFSVQELQMVDLRILIPLVAAVPAVLIYWSYRKKRRLNLKN